jgi:hypothetical protein
MSWSMGSLPSSNIFTANAHKALLSALVISAAQPLKSHRKTKIAAHIIISKIFITFALYLLLNKRVSAAQP